MSPVLTPASVPVLQIESGVATITLNRPAQRNRLENADLTALLAHFDAVNLDPEVRVMVLTANTAGQPRPLASTSAALTSQVMARPFLKKSPMPWLPCVP